MRGSHWNNQPPLVWSPKRGGVSIAKPHELIDCVALDKIHDELKDSDDDRVRGIFANRATNVNCQGQGYSGHIFDQAAHDNFAT